MNIRAISSRILISLGSLSLLGPIVFAQGAPGDLNFEYFKNEVQPIFLAKRNNNVRCIQCHTTRTRFLLQPLDDHAMFWTDEQSRLNYASARGLVVPGEDPLQSRLLTHTLATSAGGDPFHGGGQHFASQDDPEWLIIADWVAGASSRREPSDVVVRIIQTNAAGDDSHVIDPATNEIVGIIEDIEIAHGITSAPDGSQLYLSNEALHSLDIVDSRTLRVKRRIPLSGRPNNISVGKDGRKVYVGIMEMPGSVDIIDTRAMANVKTLPVDGAIHNVYVTPDGKHAVAGSIHTSTINVIDTATDELAWTLKMSAGIRPMPSIPIPMAPRKIFTCNFPIFTVLRSSISTRVRKLPEWNTRPCPVKSRIRTVYKLRRHMAWAFRRMAKAYGLPARSTATSMCIRFPTSRKSGASSWASIPNG